MRRGACDDVIRPQASDYIFKRGKLHGDYLVKRSRGCAAVLHFVLFPGWTKMAYMYFALNANHKLMHHTS